MSGEAGNAPVYFDCNASAPVDPLCCDLVMECMERSHGNPSSKHAAGEKSKQYVDDARGQVAQLLKASPAEIVFTSGGTEGNHHAILGALATVPGKRHVVTSAVEHPSTMLLFKYLERQGVSVTYLPVDGEGRIEAAAVGDAITADTALVSLMWANNETGVVYPVAEAARIAKEKGVLFHSDAVQAAGKLPIDLREAPVDLLTLSGHKLHAPSGVGALYLRKGVKIPPLLYGHQERARRGGTQNVPGIAAMGVACLLAGDGLEQEMPRIAALRDRLEKGVRDSIPLASVNGAGAHRLVNTSSIRFGELNGEAIVTRLDRAGVCVSQGAACSAGGSEPSHVLMAMGLSPEGARATIRFSMGRYNKPSEVERVIGLLAEIVASGVADAA